jgi:hypothetical protein
MISVSGETTADSDTRMGRNMSGGVAPLWHDSSGLSIEQGDGARQNQRRISASARARLRSLCNIATVASICGRAYYVPVCVWSNCNTTL